MPNSITIARVIIIKRIDKCEIKNASRMLAKLNKII